MPNDISRPLLRRVPTRRPVVAGLLRRMDEYTLRACEPPAHLRTARRPAGR